MHRDNLTLDKRKFSCVRLAKEHMALDGSHTICENNSAKCALNQAAEGVFGFCAGFVFFWVQAPKSTFEKIHGGIFWVFADNSKVMNFRGFGLYVDRFGENRLVGPGCSMDFGEDVILTKKCTNMFFCKANILRQNMNRDANVRGR